MPLLAALQEEYDTAVATWGEERKAMQDQINRLQLEVNKTEGGWVIVCRWFAGASGFLLSIRTAPVGGGSFSVRAQAPL